MKSKLTLGLLVTALALGLTAGCGNRADSREQAPPEAVQAALYEVRQETLPRYSTSMGTFEGFQRAQLSTRVMGNVRRVLVEEGQPVRRGQTLVELDREDVQSRIEQSRAMLQAAASRMNNAKVYYERIAKLHEQQSASRQQLDNARTQYESAQAEESAAHSRVREAGSNLGYTVIAAPFDGVISEKRVQAGDLASPGQPLLTVEAQERLKVRTTVSEQELGAIAVGDTVRVETDLPGAKPLRAVVETIDPGGDPRTRRFAVKLVLLDQGEGCRSGMFARVFFRTGDEQAVAVPDSAVVRRGQLTGLYVVDDRGLSRLRWVQLGRRADQRVTVLSGLAPGDRVIVSGLRLMREGRSIEEAGR